jgi:hypothetical protein
MHVVIDRDTHVHRLKSELNLKDFEAAETIRDWHPQSLIDMAVSSEGEL